MHLVCGPVNGRQRWIEAWVSAALEITSIRACIVYENQSSLCYDQCKMGKFYGVVVHLAALFQAFLQVFNCRYGFFCSQLPGNL